MTKKMCPECQHIFQGNGWDGIDAHWRSKHQDVMPYEEAWPLLKDGRYKRADPDADLEAMNPLALIAAARAMRVAIRAHRDTSGHDLCWHQPELWALLPDPPRGGQLVPEWPQFLRGCVRYRQSLDEQFPDASRTTREFSS